MYLVFTNFDKTMLDLEGPALGLARSALDLIRLHDVPLILTTEKTAIEAQILRMVHFNAQPFIVENGSAAYIPKGLFKSNYAVSRQDGRYDVVEFGASREDIIAAVNRAATRLRFKVDWLPSEAERQALTNNDAQREKPIIIRDRKYSAVFESSSSKVKKLSEALVSDGFTVYREGQSYVVSSVSGRGRAFRLLLDLFTLAGLDPRPIWLDLGLGAPPVNDIFQTRLTLWHETSTERLLPDPEAWRRRLIRFVIEEGKARGESDHRTEYAC